METNRWWTIRDQSLARYMRNAGFDLSVYSNYSDHVQNEARKRAIKEAMAGIREAFEAESQFSLTDLDRGVYVISLSTPLAISYRSRWSPVIYVGLGRVASRIEAHFNHSLFDFMESLSGANFDFSFACPHKPYHTDYYKHIEYEMLNYFQEKIGDGNFPILNKNAGSNRDIVHDDAWWTSPLKANGKRPLWALGPTEHSDFAPLDE